MTVYILDKKSAGTIGFATETKIDFEFESLKLAYNEIGITESNFDTTTNTLNVVIDGVTYPIEITQGQNFYLVVRDEESVEDG